MRRKMELIIGLLVLIGVIALAGKLSSYVSQDKVKEGKVQVIIDPGHGGRDPGKEGAGGSLEKEINLEIALRLKEQLEKKNITVMMTREEDIGLYQEDTSNKKAEDMRNRVQMINDSKPALTVSLHQNSYTGTDVKGAQVFYFTHSKESEKVAKLMQECLRKVDPDNSRQAKADNTYYMLKKTEVPTIIVEAGFLSNPEEEAKLNDAVYQEELATAICDGIVDSLKLLENAK